MPGSFLISQMMYNEKHTLSNPPPSISTFTAAQEFCCFPVFSPLAHLDSNNDLKQQIAEVRWQEWPPNRWFWPLVRAVHEPLLVNDLLPSPQHGFKSRLAEAKSITIIDLINLKQTMDALSTVYLKDMKKSKVNLINSKYKSSDHRSVESSPIPSFNR